LPSSIASAGFDRYALRDRGCSKLAVPCACDRVWDGQRKTAPRTATAFQLASDTMPAGSEPVNDGATDGELTCLRWRSATGYDSIP
jgi:hypothetical protein